MGSLYSEHLTWLHRWRAGAKLFVLAVLGIVLLSVQSPWVMGAIGLGCALLYASLGAATRHVKRLFILSCIGAAMVATWHICMGSPLLGVVSGLRLASIAMLGMALTVTTRSGDLVDVLEWLLRPLQRFGVNSDRLALQLALMLRFIEHFFVQWKKLDDAHRLRTGKRGGWHILAPLIIQVLNTARRVGDAIFARLGG